jgi:hypothetical protein
VPYLSVSKHSETLNNYALKNYKEAKHDLATIFLEKLLKWEFLKQKVLPILQFQVSLVYKKAFIDHY